MKAYECICQVCGVRHAIQADFLSASRHRAVDGRELAVLSCGKHTGEEIRAAWNQRSPA